MAEASKICPYEQGYLSLLCRRGQLKGRKIARKWYTTTEWLNEYLIKMRPESVIKKERKHGFRRRKFFPERLIFKSGLVWALSLIGLAVLVLGTYSMINRRIERIEKEKNQFVPEEIIKVPNEEGSYDVYGKGKIKIGEEKIKTGETSLNLNP